MKVNVNGFWVSTATARVRTAISLMCAGRRRLSSIASNSSSGGAARPRRAEPRRKTVEHGCRSPAKISAIPAIIQLSHGMPASM